VAVEALDQMARVSRTAMMSPTSIAWAPAVARRAQLLDIAEHLSISGMAAKREGSICAAQP